MATRVKWKWWCPSPADEINSRLLSQWDATTVLDSVPPARTASFSTSTVPQHLVPFLAALKGGSEAEDGDGAASSEDAPVQHLLNMKIAELMWWLFVAAGPYAGLSFLEVDEDEEEPEKKIQEEDDDAKKRALFIYLAPVVLDLAATQKDIVECVFIRLRPRSKQKEKKKKKEMKNEKTPEEIRLAPERREEKCLKHVVRRLVEYGCAARQQEHRYPSVALALDRCLAFLLNLIHDRHSRRWAYPRGTYITE